MPRRGNVPKREILPDPIYGSVLVTKLVNSIMLDGKKGVAQKVVYGAFQIVEEKTGKSGLEAFQTAMENIMPAVEVKTRRVGGANYQVPIEVRNKIRSVVVVLPASMCAMMPIFLVFSSEYCLGMLFSFCHYQRK